MDYSVKEEEAGGDLIIEVNGAQKRLRARRESPGQAQTPILVDGTILPNGTMQISCLKYRWPDGYEKWGPYIGSIHALESA